MAYRAEKELKLYYSISEVAEQFQVAESLLRYWEKEFPTMIAPRKVGRARQYTKEDLEKLRLVYHLVKERGMTLQGARATLKANKAAAQQTMEVTNRLKAIREELLRIRDEIDASVEY